MLVPSSSHLPVSSRSRYEHCMLAAGSSDTAWWVQVHDEVEKFLARRRKAEEDAAECEEVLPFRDFLTCHNF